MGRSASQDTKRLRHSEKFLHKEIIASPIIQGKMKMENLVDQTVYVCYIHIYVAASTFVSWFGAPYPKSLELVYQH